MNPPEGAVIVNGFDHYAISEDGILYSKAYGNWRIVKGHFNNHGYRVAHLCKSGIRHRKMIHSLVAEMFIGSRPKGTEIRHLDGNKLNNHYRNLSYGTHSENMRDTVRHGHHVSQVNPGSYLRGDNHPNRINAHLLPRGENSTSAIMRTDHVIAAKALRRLGYTVSSIARFMSVPRGALHNAVLGYTWKHVKETDECLKA
jgi:hypothetical protein